MAQGQAVRVVERPEELAADVWESDSELEKFLADTYRARASMPHSRTDPQASRMLTETRSVPPRLS